MGHPLHQSVLYHLTTRTKLAKSLCVSTDELKHVCAECRYSSREIVTKAGKYKNHGDSFGKFISAWLVCSPL